jgi:DNA-directed RNA polymerase specialized sigma24 family protein
MHSEMIRRNPKTDEALYLFYRSASLRFCESLIKNKSEAEKMVCAVFSELRDNGSEPQSDPDFKTCLFTRLRNQVFHYLKTRAKNELSSGPSEPQSNGNRINHSLIRL